MQGQYENAWKSLTQGIYKVVFPPVWTFCSLYQSNISVKASCCYQHKVCISHLVLKLNWINMGVNLRAKHI